MPLWAVETPRGETRRVLAMSWQEGQALAVRYFGEGSHLSDPRPPERPMRAFGGEPLTRRAFVERTALPGVTLATAFALLQFGGWAAATWGLVMCWVAVTFTKGSGRRVPRASGAGLEGRGSARTQGPGTSDAPRLLNLVQPALGREGPKPRVDAPPSRGSQGRAVRRAGSPPRGALGSRRVELSAPWARPVSLR